MIPEGLACEEQDDAEWKEDKEWEGDHVSENDGDANEQVKESIDGTFYARISKELEDDRCIC